MKTAIAIVIYNKWCGDSNTCQFLKNTNFPPDYVLVIDNSTKPVDNENYCKENGWTYHSMQGNAGLTKAYNAALNILKDKTDVIVWADDDTRFTDTYFESLKTHVSNNPDAAVFLPIVKANNTIISPCIFSTGEMIVAESVEALNGKEMSGINSGMAVKTSLYDNYRYDEGYFLDYVDHDFLRWCRLNSYSFCVMDDITLIQSFFAQSNPSKKAKRIRFNIYKKDYARFQRKCGVSRFRIIEHLLKKYIYEQFISG